MDVNFDIIESYRNKNNHAYGVLSKLCDMTETGIRKGIQTKSLKFNAVKLIADFYKIPDAELYKMEQNKSSIEANEHPLQYVTSEEKLLKVQLEAAQEKIKLLEKIITLMESKK